ncbi:MAG: flagellar hook-basal body complex protein [Oscillospiraceae bacterium]|nr:flagellar hook-basal body complex protein [Oscillospiraceae bacterium]
MVKSLYTGVTGLKTHQQRMDVIGNNIANVNTVGYKTDVVTFADIYYQSKRSPSAGTSTRGGVNPRQVGYGVKVNSVTANMTASGYTQSDKTTDLALDGEGFFQVMSPSGQIYYTRAGDFYIDDDGYLVNADGYYVLGVTGDSTGVAASNDLIRISAPATNANRSSITKLVNGTNVTLTVDAPSEYTDMTVSFKHAEFPYATFQNNILTVFINTDQQYNSEDEFNQAVLKALQTGGVTLPDDVSLNVTFEEIPNDYLAQAAKNDVQDIVFTTTTSTARFHYSDTVGGKTLHSYIDFSVIGSGSTDKVDIAYDPAVNKARANYENGTWTITVREDTTAADINSAIKSFLNDNPTVSVEELKCSGFLIPSGLDKRTVLQAFDTGTAAGDTAVVEAGNAGVIDLKGVEKGAGITGAFDFNVKDEGEFANNYKIVFAYKSSYGATTAVWEENTLTVNIAPDSTVYDVNEAIKKAANGNTKKLIKFNNINGLQYGYGEVGGTGKVTTSTTTDADGNPVTVTTTEYNAGFYSIEQGGTTTWYDKDGRELTGDQVPTADDTAEKDPTDAAAVWNVGIRQAFFGDNPKVNPKGGKDSFFTQTAKSMSSFNLQDGRLGSEQPLKSITDLIIQNDGTIIGYHAVHGYMNLGRIDIALFDNPNGLAKVTGTTFRATVASGDPRLAVAGEDGAGSVLSGTLEMSNVDLADEFTNMIATQRGYQANSRVVTVSDTMIEELLNLKR